MTSATVLAFMEIVKGVGAIDSRAVLSGSYSVAPFLSMQGVWAG